MIQRVKEKLGEAVTWSLWQGFVIAVNSEKHVLLFCPNIINSMVLKMNKERRSIRFVL